MLNTSCRLNVNQSDSIFFEYLILILTSIDILVLAAFLSRATCEAVHSSMLIKQFRASVSSVCDILALCQNGKTDRRRNPFRASVLAPSFCQVFNVLFVLRKVSK